MELCFGINTWDLLQNATDLRIVFYWCSKLGHSNVITLNIQKSQFLTVFIVFDVIVYTPISTVRQFLRADPISLKAYFVDVH